MAGSQVSAGSLAPDDDDGCHHRKTDDPVRREVGMREGEQQVKAEKRKGRKCREVRSSHLQHLVWGGLNAGRHVGWAVCSLLHVHEIVGGILVQHNLAHWDQWEVSMGPHLCEN